MTDLWILVPSRGRPQNVERLAEACAKTCRADTRLHFGFDDDDLARDSSNIGAAAGHDWSTRAREGLTGWTNWLAGQHTDDSLALASVGDDMVPETDGWDAELLSTLDKAGGGFAYPFDGRRADIPECCVISTPIVRALGWMALPTSTHWFIDNTWKDLAAPDRLFYRPDITVRHLHPKVAGAHLHDQTYEDAAGLLSKDLAAYQRWRIFDMPKDREAVRAACSAPPA